MNAIVLQSGGPTAVINASLWQLTDSWRRTNPETSIWGARQGWRGLVEGDWVDLTEWRFSIEAQLGFITQPGAALGSGRDRLEDKDLPGLIERLRHREIGVVFVIGGNGSMAAARRLHAAAGKAVRVIGVPKTIDNDLAGTDVCPGYPSAARWIAGATRDVGLDLHAMRGFDDVAILEVMGRNAGWLAAASALARWKAGTPPHLILLPEVPFEEEAFVAAVKAQNDREGCCLVVTSEGVRDRAGTFVAEKGRVMDRDASGQELLALAGGPTPYLARLVRDRLKLRCRQIRPDTIQRSPGSSVGLPTTDGLLALGVGSRAVAAHAEGHSGVMMGVRWIKGKPEREILPVPLDEVIGRERLLPPEFIDAANFDVTSKFLEYAKPLIGDWNPEAVVL